jgi:Zn-dependent protease with chaperone function
MRAVASIVMLFGFSVVALLQLIAAVAVLVWVGAQTNPSVGLKVGLPLVLAVGAALVGLGKAIRARPAPMPGLVLDEAHHGWLWGLVRQLADQVGTRAPDEIRLVPDVNAAVSEDARALGLIPGTRRLYLGLPLMLALTVDQLRSVLAHELGHYSGAHTRLGAVAYRGRLAIGHTIGRIGRWNPVGWVFRGYARLYLLVDNAASRRQELEADRASVRVAGPEAAVATLRELPVIGAAWGFYFDRYIAGGWELGFAPDDIFGGFGMLVASRGAELDRLRAEEPRAAKSRWDTHPSIGSRIAVMRATPPTSHPVDGRPATVLLPSIAAAGRALQAEVFAVGDRKVLPWPEFTAATVTTGLQSEADQVFRQVSRLTGATAPSLGDLLALVAAGRLPELARHMYPADTEEEATAHLGELMKLLVVLAAIRSGVAYWLHSWSEPVQLVDRHGNPLDFEPVAKLAMHPHTLPEAQARMRAFGIRAAAASVVERSVTADGAEVIGALTGIKVDGHDHDLILLNRGFVPVPSPKSSGNGADRLRRLLGAGPVEELARRHRFVPYEEVVGVVVGRRAPVRAELHLHGGETVALEQRWGGEKLGKSDDTLLAVLDRLAERAPAV